TLFVSGVGRTDLPGGSWPKMLDSIKSRILTLPDDTTVWPGHHYGMAPKSTVKEERETNDFLR
ncbi:MAG: MBL fold metallo-hydrolase, partial [Pseudomonadota bacterium]